MVDRRTEIDLDAAEYKKGNFVQFCTLGSIRLRELKVTAQYLGENLIT